MSGERPGEMRIGERLEAARIRASLDLATVEDRTKIRRKYLRALEDERWDELPSSAYAKGFLRSYAELLGLDAEAIVDEYRRQVEVEPEPSMHPLGDRVIEGRQRATPRRQSSSGRLWALGALLVLGAAVIVALIASGDDSEPPPREPAEAPQGGDRATANESAPDDATVELAFRVRDPVEVCLVGGGGEALIDGQLLSAGDRERFERKRFKLRFPAGFEPDQMALKIAGKSRRLPRKQGPAAFSITPPRHLVAARPPGEDCP